MKSTINVLRDIIKLRMDYNRTKLDRLNAQLDLLEHSYSKFYYRASEQKLRDHIDALDNYALNFNADN